MSDETKKEDGVGAWIALFLTFPLVLLEGVVLSDAWNWFISDLAGFRVGPTRMSGVAVLVAVLVLVSAVSTRSVVGKERDSLVLLFKEVIGLLFFWLIAFVLHRIGA